jgi:DNA-binding transcriptional LysR family regulator
MPTEVTLQRLAYFVAVAEQQSFRKAAAMHQAAQPGVSGQIAVLERRLGVRLFVRTRQGAQLTSIGRQLLPRARQIVAAVERLVEYSGDLRSGEEGVVSIACSPVHVERFLATVIGEFKASNERIRIDLAKMRDDRPRGSGRSSFDELIAGEVDVSMGPPQLHPGITGLKGFDARMLLVLPDDHPRRHDPQVPIDVLKDQPVLIAPAVYPGREQVDAAARASGFELSVAAETSSPAALVALTRNHLGWAVLTDEHWVVHHSAAPHPVIVDGDGAELLTPVWLQWLADVELSAAATRFVECARGWAERERATPLAAASWAMPQAPGGAAPAPRSP